MSGRAKNVGILAIELYFPSQYVDQAKLEKYDGVPAGKYTIGLGQKKMGFCSDREDINSLCLTVVSRLIEKNNIDIYDIGRLEVGTETVIDKSKSVKTVLMELFEPHGATDIEGLDTTNACYGGTAALFNAINWMESSSWDGRKAIVVAGDIAVYAKGPARPTGGAGSVAILVGPNAPLVFDQGIRATYMKHAYDFYKADLSSEYAYVDGRLSIQCYLSSLDNCYQLFCKKMQKQEKDFKGLTHLDSMLFHTPFGKLVQKSLARITLIDFLLTPKEQRVKQFPGLEKFDSVKLEDTYFDRDVEKEFMVHSAKLFEEKTKPSLHVSSNVGNMYTPSLYGGLVSYLASKSVSELAGKRFGLFSYGSGLASSMYSITITKDATIGSPLQKLLDQLKQTISRLDERIDVEPAVFTSILDMRAKSYNSAPYEPVGSIDVLFPGTYYLKSIDDQRRRTYAQKKLS